MNAGLRQGIADNKNKVLLLDSAINQVAVDQISLLDSALGADNYLVFDGLAFRLLLSFLIAFSAPVYVTDLIFDAVIERVQTELPSHWIFPISFKVRLCSSRLVVLMYASVTALMGATTESAASLSPSFRHRTCSH